MDLLKVAKNMSNRSKLFFCEMQGTSFKIYFGESLDTPRSMVTRDTDFCQNYITRPFPSHQSSALQKCKQMLKLEGNESTNDPKGCHLKRKITLILEIVRLSARL